jgi:hypothetical protein
MPGSRPLNPTQGDRGEYLAQYLLSYIGLPLPVLRQLDIGIDFICNISKEEFNLLTFSHPFSIQIKKLNEQTNSLSNPISFGGIKKNGKWKKYEIEWLFNPGIPFYIGILDLNKPALFLYSTSAIWFAFHSVKMPTEIILEPRIYSDNNAEVHSPQISKYSNFNLIQSESDGNTHTIDLGQPVVTLDIDNVRDPEYITKQKEILQNLINRIDMRNIVQKNLESSFFWWNKFQNSDNIAWSTNPWSPNFNQNKLKEELIPILVPLALYCKDKGIQSTLDQISPLLRYIKDLVPIEIRKNYLKEIFE